MRITITPDAGAHPFEVDLSQEAMDAVRLTFNPSGMDSVTELKVVAAALYQMNLNTGQYIPDSGRAAAVARTNVQTASMWGVFAATTPAVDVREASKG